MSFKKSLLLIFSGSALSLSLIYLVIQIIDVPIDKSYTPQVIENFSSKHEKKTAQTKPVINDAQNKKTDLEKIEEDIATLSDTQVNDELEQLKTHVYETNLIDRLNHGLVGEQEQEDAKKILDRIMLLGIAKAERELLKLTPELKQAIAKQEKNLAHVKNILRN